MLSNAGMLRGHVDNLCLDMIFQSPCNIYAQLRVYEYGLT